MHITSVFLNKIIQIFSTDIFFTCISTYCLSKRELKKWDVLSLILRYEGNGLPKSPVITSIPGLDESHFYKHKKIYPRDFQIAFGVIRTK